jgi:diguanylate cyclase (GGDEF) domain
MDKRDAAPRSDGSQTHLRPTVVRLRLMAAIALSGLVGISIERFVSLLVPGSATLAALCALAAMLLTGVAVAPMALVPLRRSTEDLQLRYEIALADALCDGLTKLGNHRAFQEELDRQVEQALRYETPLALVLIDLDDFKALNDAVGHVGGDHALTRTGRLVEASIRRPDRAFRIGGDEFALLLPHADAEGARVVVRRLLAASLQPGRAADGLAEGLSFSAGISTTPAFAANRSELHAQADAALYAAKRAGRTTVEVFEPSIGPALPLTDASAAVAELIARKQMLGVYQPVVDLSAGKIIGYEGLTRPQRPSPFETPAQLFEAAEASGRVMALDLACVEELVLGARSLPATQFLSVNLSPATIEAAEFGAASILAILARHDFPPARLVIELTERESITDMARLREKLEACRRAGIRLAADDIGAGNSGLRLLSELRFDILKVDLGLVQRSAADGLSSAVVHSVVDLAARTGALVIAEGVEEDRQLVQVAALGITAGQGYLLGRPGPLPVRGERSAAVMQDPAEDASPHAAWRESIGLSGAILPSRV